MSQFIVSMGQACLRRQESLLDPEGVAPVITFTKGQGPDLVVGARRLGPDDVKIFVKNLI